MKKFSPILHQLLDLLRDGSCYCANTLSERLKVPEAVVTKHISQLIDLGIRISYTPIQGYQLITPMIPLSESEIRASLKHRHFNQHLDIHLFAEINSTNQYLKELASRNLSLCCAEKQTNGRGRFGREWTSPFGENIYFSLSWPWHSCISKLSGLSLIVSLATLACIKSHAIHNDILIKWPNDLLWQHKKLAGILIELITENDGFAKIIIGIGINTNTDTVNQPLPNKLWCSLYEITGGYFDRNQLIASLIYNLNEYLEQYITHGMEPFLAEWNSVDYLKNQWITISKINSTMSGYARGIDSLGQLRLEDEQGKIIKLSSGDTSLAKQSKL